MPRRSHVVLVALALTVIFAAQPALAEDLSRSAPVGLRLAVGPEVGVVGLLGLRLGQDDIEDTGETTSALWLGVHLEWSWVLASRFAMGVGLAVGLARQGGEPYGVTFRPGGTAVAAVVEMPLRFLLSDPSTSTRHWSWLPYVALHPRLGAIGEPEGAGPILGLEARLGGDLVSPAGNALGIYAAIADDSLALVRASVGLELVSE